jgi:hypothetical protein
MYQKEVEIGLPFAPPVIGREGGRQSFWPRGRLSRAKMGDPIPELLQSTLKPTKRYDG